jgi:hypothetical protein
MKQVLFGIIFVALFTVKATASTLEFGTAEVPVTIPFLLELPAQKISGLAQLTGLDSTRKKITLKIPNIQQDGSVTQFLGWEGSAVNSYFGTQCAYAESVTQNNKGIFGYKYLLIVEELADPISYGSRVNKFNIYGTDDIDKCMLSGALPSLRSLYPLGTLTF